MYMYIESAYEKEIEMIEIAKITWVCACVYMSLYCMSQPVCIMHIWMIFAWNNVCMHASTRGPMSNMLTHSVLSWLAELRRTIFTLCWRK